LTLGAIFWKEPFMAAWLVLSLAIVGQTANSASANSAKADDDPREVSAIRKEVSKLLRTESAATDDATRRRQVQRMSEVYLEVVGDERFVANPLLQQQKSKLHTRLLKIRDELRRRQSIDQRSAQRRGGVDDQGQSELAASLATHLQLASQTLGGPGVVFAGASGGAPIDYADDLIDLITETISPTHWNVNGGEGSIMFYRPALALVVRASSEVQNNVGGLLGGLRE
jgi:hypothetical protein